MNQQITICATLRYKLYLWPITNRITIPFSSSSFFLSSPKEEPCSVPKKYTQGWNRCIDQHTGRHPCSTDWIPALPAAKRSIYSNNHKILSFSDCFRELKVTRNRWTIHDWFLRGSCSRQFCFQIWNRFVKRSASNHSSRPKEFNGKLRLNKKNTWSFYCIYFTYWMSSGLL